MTTANNNSNVNVNQLLEKYLGEKSAAELIKYPLSNSFIDDLLRINKSWFPDNIYEPLLIDTILYEISRTRIFSKDALEIQTAANKLLARRNIKTLKKELNKLIVKAVNVLIKVFKTVEQAAKQIEVDSKKTVREAELTKIKTAKQEVQNKLNQERQARFKLQASLKEALPQLDQLYTELNNCIEEEVEMFLLKIRYQQRLVNELTSLIK